MYRFNIKNVATIVSFGFNRLDLKINWVKRNCFSYSDCWCWRESYNRCSVVVIRKNIMVRWDYPIEMTFYLWRPSVGFWPKCLGPGDVTFFATLVSVTGFVHTRKKSSFIFRSIRLAFLVTVISFQICQLRAGNYQAEMSLKMERNKALFGHSFLNISGLTMPDKCLEHCLKNCLCMSFQICDDTIECQLCLANKYLKPLEMKPSQGCTNYDFGNREETEVKNQSEGFF